MLANPRNIPWEALDLAYCIAADGQLYRQRVQPIITKLKKKIRKGDFPKEWVAVFFKDVVEAGVQQYAVKFGTPPRDVRKLSKDNQQRLLRDTWQDYRLYGNGPGRPRKADMAGSIFTPAILREAVQELVEIYRDEIELDFSDGWEKRLETTSKGALK